MVDDHAAVREAVAEECRGLGCQVETAADGAAALELVDCFKPDLIVLDFHMPVMNGSEFALRYRQRCQCQATLVLLTAETDIERHARDMGADAWISKGDPDALRPAIASLLSP